MPTANMTSKDWSEDDNPTASAPPGDWGDRFVALVPLGMGVERIFGGMGPT